jgi:hypothetical protein
MTIKQAPQAVITSSTINRRQARRLTPWIEQSSVDQLRQCTAIALITLYCLWVILGLITFVVNENFWLLASATLLTWVVYKIVNYYFGGTEERG